MGKTETFELYKKASQETEKHLEQEANSTLKLRAIENKQPHVSKFAQVPYLLFFKDEKLEKSFVNYYYGKTRIRFKLALILVAIIWIVFLYGDITKYDLRSEREWAYWSIIGLRTIPPVISLLALCLVFLPLYKVTPWATDAISLAVTGSYSISITLMSAFSHIPSYHFFPVGTMLTVFILFLLPRVRIVVLYSVAILTMVVFVGSHIIVNMEQLLSDTGRLLIYFTAMFLILIIGLLSLLTSETFFRRLFVLDVMIKYETNAVIEERELTTKLLQNILPINMVPQVKRNNRRFVQEYEEMTVLLSDIVDFTKLSSRVSADVLMNILNIKFCVFDTLAIKHQLEKVKTIGDAYFVVSLKENHAYNALMCGLHMLYSLWALNKANKWGLRIRIGIASGPGAVAIFGYNKITFDAFGKTISLAELLEQTSKPDKIHLSMATKEGVPGLSYTPNISAPSLMKSNHHNSAHSLLSKNSQSTYFLNIEDNYRSFVLREISLKQLMKWEAGELYIEATSSTRKNPPLLGTPSNQNYNGDLSPVSTGGVSLHTMTPDASSMKRSKSDYFEPSSNLPARLSWLKSASSSNLLVSSNTNDEEGGRCITTLLKNSPDAERSLQPIQFESDVDSIASSQQMAKIDKKTFNYSIIFLCFYRFSTMFWYLKFAYQGMVSHLKFAYFLFLSICGFQILTMVVIYPTLATSATLYVYYSLFAVALVNALLYLVPFLNRNFFYGVFASCITLILSVLFVTTLFIIAENELYIREFIGFTCFFFILSISILTNIPAVFNFILQLLLCAFLLIMVVIIAKWRDLATFALIVVCCAFALVSSYGLNFSLLKAFIYKQRLDQRLEESRKERDVNEQLIQSTLPTTVVKRLKENPLISSIHDRIQGGVLFAKLIGFEKKVNDNAILSISLLNDIFSAFDAIISQEHCIKIKSIGNSYLCVSVNDPTEEIQQPTEFLMAHIARCALQMRVKAYEILEEYSSSIDERDFSLKIGMNFGNMFCGIVGTSKWLYDCFGDTVNVASRMCTTSEEDMIQVSENGYDLISHVFTFQKRGPVFCKGKGNLLTYSLLKETK